MFNLSSLMESKLVLLLFIESKLVLLHLCSNRWSAKGSYLIRDHWLTMCVYLLLVYLFMCKSVLGWFICLCVLYL